MDYIEIQGLRLFAHHGVYDFETKQGQTFVVNARLYADLRRPGRTDALEDSTDYGNVCHFLTAYLQEHTCKLIEAAAEQAARALLLHYPLVRAVDFTLCKPEAPIGLPFENASVTLHRGWRRVLIAYGANKGDAEAQINRGLAALAERPTVRLLGRSDTITTEPYGGVEQPPFRNGVIEVETILSPAELLELLHEIEASEGRDRAKEIHWGPRPLDLDILDYEGEVCRTASLTLPHPDMQNRDFVLVPLVQVAPYWYHPLLRKTATELLQALQTRSC